ncbi:head-tail adaptor protein [Streptomyces sp. NPDC057235]|uniref:phage head completion protein n=1 Tax=Streptomyces sp. NPDC057235 TaxID=3346058 RepID=UPI0036394B25
MSGPGRYYNRRLEVWRTSTVPDGAGGETTTEVLVARIRAQVDQPSPTERLIAQQAASSHSHNVYTDPRADVRRGDELRGADPLGQMQHFRVQSVVWPSRPIYAKALCELTQSEGG